MKEAIYERQTKETKVCIKLNLEEEKVREIHTGIGFFDHMLDLFAFHSQIGLEVLCQGDLEVDGHHSVEDIGIGLGKAIYKALGDKKGIHRYGDCFLPMDETLAHCSLDISGRPYLVFHVELPSKKVGEFETELAEEFFRAVAMNAGLTLHFNLEYGKNTHHILEALFKSFGRALKQAITIEEQNRDKVMSSKGVIESDCHFRL